jgi:EAL domain-containing protein (putative c-di-GMP-specific phosphodiesterase class I)
MAGSITRRSFGTIRRFLRGDGFWIVFQPIADLDTGSVLGFEALARFDGQPPRPPAAWFADAADAGLRRELELATARAAVDAMESIPEGAWLTVNVSPDIVSSPAFLSTVAGAPAGRLVVEITEHAPIDDYEVLNAALQSLRDKGVRVAIDDAGAGFANMTHMLRLDVDLIKLDIELTRHIDIDAKRKALVASMVEFARSVGATVVAEGIETEAELAALRRLGVPFGQGYHVGRPQALRESAGARESSAGPAPRRIWHSATTTVSDAVSFRRSRRALLRTAPRRRFARSIAALAVAAGLLLYPAATAYAENSLPGTPGWWIKRRIEDTRIAFAGSPAAEVRLQLAFARRRVDEVSELVGRGEPAGVKLALSDYLRRVEVIDRFVPHLVFGPAGLADRIREDLTGHVATLTRNARVLCGRGRSRACAALDGSLTRSKAALEHVPSAGNAVTQRPANGPRGNGETQGGDDKRRTPRAPKRDPKPARTPPARAGSSPSR